MSATFKSVSGYPNLVTRGTTFYFRCSIEQELRHFYPKSQGSGYKSHLVKSLRTSDRKTAIDRWRIEQGKIQEEFYQFRLKVPQEHQTITDRLTAEQLSKIEEVYYWHLLQEDEDSRDDGYFDPDEPSEPLHPAPRPTYEEQRESIEASLDSAKHHLARAKWNKDWHPAEAQEVLSWASLNIDLAADSPDWPNVYRAIIKAEVKGYQALLERLNGEVVNTPEEPSTSKEAKSDALLSKAIVEWARSQMWQGNWTELTKRDHLIAMEQFIEFAGDLPITSYTR